MYLKKKNHIYILINIFGISIVVAASSPAVEADNNINQTKKEQRSLHFARRQPSSNRSALKSSSATARDVTYTQFAVIDDDNISAMQQVTRGGGGKY